MSENEKERNPEVNETDVPELDPKVESRREFFSSLGKWSKVVIAAVVLGEAVGAPEASSYWSNGGWHNGGWHNGGWHNGGWHNGGWWNGGWKNKWNNGGWYNGGWSNYYSK